MAFDYCVKCGACCKNISSILTLIPEFSEKINANGDCIYLNEENLCSIYESRPEFCQWSEVHKKFFNELSVLEFQEKCRSACNQFKK